MVIKPQDGYHRLFAWLSVVLVIISLFMFIALVLPDTELSFSEKIILAILFPCYFALIFVPMYVSGARTFTLDAAGCTVSLGPLHKLYPWDKMKTKCIDNFATAIEVRGSADNRPGKGITLCVHRTRRPCFVPVELYCAFRHPFSYVYFQFIPVNQQNREPVGYEANKKEILTLLEGWGVHLRERKF